MRYAYEIWWWYEICIIFEISKYPISPYKRYRTIHPDKSDIDNFQKKSGSPINLGYISRRNRILRLQFRRTNTTLLLRIRPHRTISGIALSLGLIPGKPERLFMGCLNFGLKLLINVLINDYKHTNYLYIFLFESINKTVCKDICGANGGRL